MVTMRLYMRYLILLGLGLLVGPPTAVVADPVNVDQLPADQGAPAGPEAEAKSPQQQRFEAAASGLSLFSPRLLQAFYAERDFQLAWSTDQAEAMLALSAAGVEHGLAPSDFHAEPIRTLLESSTLRLSDEGAARWRADLLLSDALLRYLHHLQYGKHNPRHLDPDWTYVDAIDAADLQQEMREVLAAADLRAAVEALLPSPPFYEQLRAGYAKYLALSERLQAQGGWRPLQGRSGLAQDGVVGPRTLAALNQPFETRLALIRANLERMRWLYHDLPSDYVFVDIAAYQVELVRDHQQVWSTRAVVGTQENQTPMFRDEMDHLVFNPTWSVPSSIQKKMSGVPSDYNVIDRRTGRRVAASNPSDHRRYRLVQQPGPRNALGRVKFMFPNGHAIYLHDTPSRHLFARGRRSYSHGCVRVQDPLALAGALLADQNWDSSAIERVVDSGRTRYVNLEEHLPVLLYYLTARADEQGRVGFRDDLYGRDERLLAALEEPPSAKRIAFREPIEPAGEADSAAAPMPPAGPAPEHAQDPGRVVDSDAGEDSPTPEVNAAMEIESEIEPEIEPGPERAVEPGVAIETDPPADAPVRSESARELPSALRSRAWWGLSMDRMATPGADAGDPAGLDLLLGGTEQPIAEASVNARLDASVDAAGGAKPGSSAGVSVNGRSQSSSFAGWGARDLDLRPVLMR